EPVEVQGALNRHEGVRDSWVMLCRQPSGEPGLTAYFVPHGRDTPAPAELAAFARGLLPGHMVPTSFVPVAGLPLTSAGKLDHTKLPVPAAEHLAGTRVYEAPRDALEGTICSLWSELLGLERVGINDNFFEIGGHSLLALRAFARLEIETG